MSRLGVRTFEQAAGFLRIVGGENPLDASAVHPEAYPVVERILTRTGKGIREVVGNTPLLRGVDATSLVDERFGLPTVTDILSELDKPGRDPRPDFKAAAFTEGVHDLTDLKPGMMLEGRVTNVANFGAFVDIGVHQDGLVHVSHLCDRYVKDPREVVKTGDVVNAKVLEVDVQRRRIALSMRKDAVPAANGGVQAPSPGGEPATRERSKPGAPAQPQSALAEALARAMRHKA